MVDLFNTKWDLFLYAKLFNMPSSGLAQILKKNYKIPYVEFLTTYPLASFNELEAIGTIF